MKELITSIAASDTKTILHVVHYKPEHEVMPIKYQMGFLLTKQTTGVKQSYLFHMPDILVCIYRVHVGKLFLSV